MSDPLSGKREAIGKGTVYSLIWPDTGQGPPVAKRQMFPLRNCTVEITKIHRIQKKQAWRHEGEYMEAGWYWRAEFRTYRRRGDVVHYLARRGPSTTDRRQAMGMEDDPEAGTLRRISEDERDPASAARHAALGDEPESTVPDYEVRDLSGSREARQRYELEMAERRAAEAVAPLEDRLARLKEMAGERHVDISAEVRVIEQRIEKAERKVERAAA